MLISSVCSPNDVIRKISLPPLNIPVRIPVIDHLPSCTAGLVPPLVYAMQANRREIEHVCASRCKSIHFRSGNRLLSSSFTGFY